MDNSDWKTLSSKVVYTNPYMKIVENDVIRPDGMRSPYYVLTREGFAVVIPLTPEKETYLVGQYRYSLGKYSWEFPMGSVKGKTKFEMAQQELKEETGFTAAKWEPIGSFAVAPGHSNEMTEIFLAQDLTAGKPQPEAGEYLTVEKRPLTDIPKLIATGVMVDSVSISAYYLLELYLQKAQSI